MYIIYKLVYDIKQVLQKNSLQKCLKLIKEDFNGIWVNNPYIREKSDFLAAF